jgi:hypothetical protein
MSRPVSPITRTGTQRASEWQAARVAAGGRRLTITLPPHAAEALRQIQERDDCTALDAIAAALDRSARNKR